MEEGREVHGEGRRSRKRGAGSRQLRKKIVEFYALLTSVFLCAYG